MNPGYVPDAGDIVWLSFDPQAGHEQAGHRPALVLSPARYNGRRGMMVCCPMTSRIKGYPFEVVESRDPPSAVLADQVKSLDWRARRATKKGVISPAALADVQAKIRALLNLQRQRELLIADTFTANFNRLLGQDQKVVLGSTTLRRSEQGTCEVTAARIMTYLPPENWHGQVRVIAAGETTETVRQACFAQLDLEL